MLDSPGRDDFRCILIIEVDEDIENELELICFRKIFKINLDTISNEEMEMELNQKLFGSHVEVTYINKVGIDGNVDKIAQDIEFLN